ncbi:hypothetical protein [Halorhabdus tiamatea]|nr:hypothetical protein [Halorhabdus tiamatea]
MKDVGGIEGFEIAPVLEWEHAGHTKTDQYWYAAGTHGRNDLGDHGYDEISNGGINRWHTQSWFGEWTGSSWRPDRPRDPTESGTDSHTGFRGSHYRVEVKKTNTPDGDKDKLVRFTDPEPEYTTSSDYTFSGSIGVGIGPFNISASGEPLSIEFGSGGTTITMDDETNPDTPDQAYDYISWDIESDGASWYNYATSQEQSPGVKFNIESNGIQHTDYDDPYSDKDFTIQAEAQGKYMYVDQYMDYIFTETPNLIWYNGVNVV